MKFKFLNIGFLLPVFCAAQVNLVPNSDFESSVDTAFPCSWLIDSDNINDYFYNWFTPIGTTTDVISTRAGDNCWSHAPNTGEGYMQPHSGHNMAGFINYSPDGGCQPNEWHEYLSIELSQPMTPGNLYCIELYVALGSHSRYATNNIGILFTKGNPERGSCMPIFTKPQFNVEEVMDNTEDWMRIEGTIFADSAYKFLTIGNFFNHDSTVIHKRFPENARKNTEGQTQGDVVLTGESTTISNMAYYFIDDVRVYLCPSANADTGPEKQ